MQMRNDLTVISMENVMSKQSPESLGLNDLEKGKNLPLLLNQP